MFQLGQSRLVSIASHIALLIHLESRSHNRLNIFTLHIKSMEKNKQTMQVVTYGLRVCTTSFGEPADTAVCGTSIWGPIGHPTFAVMAGTIIVSDTSTMSGT